jgi:hypothetical protein
MLYYYSKYCDLQNVEIPFFFIIGDEGFYDHVRGDHRQTFFGESLAQDINTRKVFEEIKQKFAGNIFLLHLPYGSGDDKRILKQWQEILGENVIHLTDPTLVIEVMLGIIAMTMNTRTMNSYLDDFRTLYQADRLKRTDAGPDDTEAKIQSMRKILEPYSRSVNAMVKVDLQGMLPVKSDSTLRRRR